MTATSVVPEPEGAQPGEAPPDAAEPQCWRTHLPAVFGVSARWTEHHAPCCPSPGALSAVRRSLRRAEQKMLCTRFRLFSAPPRRRQD